MARHGLWAKLDAALSWHPADVNEVRTGTNNTSVQVLYQFKGVASHAAANPEDGRSALDAVELMNVGAQFLREHIPSKCRVHYAITDAGGLSPNVVQPKASVLYMVRSSNVPNTLKLLERVDKIAEGAALMTGTETKRLFLDGTADLIPNFTLERVLYENFREVGVPELTEEERAFSASLRATYEISGVSGVGPSYDKKIEEDFLRKTDGLQKPICDFLLPQFSSEGFMPGSTDVGDVSWQTPTAQINAVTLPLGCPGHSWQTVSCGKSSIAHKGMLNAGKVLALAAIDLFEDSALLAEAKNEFEKRSALGYTCPIPENLTAEEFISGVCSPPSAL